MNECLEIVNHLTISEKKTISRSLKNDGKCQLAIVFDVLTNGGGLSDISTTLNKPRPHSSMLLNQLRNNIINQLTHRHKNIPVEIELRNKINEIEFLKDRFLYDQALKRIQYLKPKLFKHERFTYVQEILLIEIEILSFVLGEKEFKQKLELIMQEHEALNKKISVFYNQKVHFYKVLAEIHTGESSHTHLPFESKPEENKSGHYFYLRSCLIQHIVHGDIKRAINAVNLLLPLIDDTPHEFDRIPFQRLDVYFMSALAHLLDGNLKEFELLNSKIAATANSHEKLEIKSVERLLYLRWLGLSLGMLSSNDVQKDLDEFQKTQRALSTEYRLRILEHISNYFLEKKSFKTAKKWNNEIINFTGKNRIKQFESRALIRSVYIAYQAKDFDRTQALSEKILSSNKSKLSYPEKIIDHLIECKKWKFDNMTTLHQYIHSFNISSTTNKN